MDLLLLERCCSLGRLIDGIAYISILFKNILFRFLDYDFVFICFVAFFNQLQIIKELEKIECSRKATHHLSLQKPSRS